MSSISYMYDEKARLARERANQIEFMRLLKEAGNYDQLRIQEINLLRIEEKIARVEQNIARELR